jgi:hypothetical protein
VKTALIIVGVVVVLLLIALLVALVRIGRRGWQRYSGLERQRASAKAYRVDGADRLKVAERRMTELERALASEGRLETMQAAEQLRRRLSTCCARFRHAEYGWTPIGAHRPVRETEMSELQERDADLMGDADRIAELVTSLHSSARDDGNLDLEILQTAIEEFESALDRRRKVN